MKMTLTIGKDEIHPLLADLSRFDPRVLLTQMGAYVVNRTHERFIEQRLWDDSGMPPSKTAQLQGRSTLVKSGRLMKSYHANPATDTEIEIGTDLVYAAAHHFGVDPYVILPKNKKALRFGKGKNPTFAQKVNHPGQVARPVLGVNDNDELWIVDLILDHVERFGR